jgi:hypothetical protein
MDKNKKIDKIRAKITRLNNKNFDDRNDKILNALEILTLVFKLKKIKDENPGIENHREDNYLATTNIIFNAIKSTLGGQQ